MYVKVLVLLIDSNLVTSVNNVDKRLRCSFKYYLYRDNK